jgi:hypothetical protein
MDIKQVELTVKDKNVKVNSLRIGNNQLIVKGRLLKIARLANEWLDCMDDVETTIDSLTKYGKIDIFTFRQKIPEVTPRYHYMMESDALSVLPMDGYDHWWHKQISSQIRNQVRKAEKLGVIVKVVEMNDELIKGIMHVFNEVPVRRGKPFWHYNKGFEAIKKEMSQNLSHSIFIGSFYDGSLVGFAKILYKNNYAQLAEYISMISHRNKLINDALFAKTVAVCDDIKIKYITYSRWRRSSHADFLRRHGFEKMILPRYYVPVSSVGKIALLFNLHKEIKDRIPEKYYELFLNYRSKWYERKSRNAPSLSKLTP